MKRFIVLITIAYILGVIIGLYNIICIVLFVISLVTYITYKIFIKTNIILKNFISLKIRLSEIYILLFIFIFGFFHAKSYNYNWEKINRNLSECSNLVEIINLEKETNYQKTFKAKIIEGENKNKNILLKIDSKQKIFNKIQIGSIVFFDGIMQEIEVQRNTGGFDYKEYLKCKKIYGILKYKEGKLIENKKYSIYSLKNNIIKNAYLKLKKEDADFMLALTIGYKSGLDQELKENFSKINLSHLLAISGMHISYLILVLNLILKHVKSKYKSVILILFLILFAQLVSDIPSVNRVCITFIMGLISPFFYRKSNIINNFAVSSLIILFQNPYTIKDLSFIFSYVGTIGIIFIYPIIKEKFEIFFISKKIIMFFQNKKNKFISIILNKMLNYFIEICLVTISANILLVPLIIYNFNSFSILCIFSNVLITPIITIEIIFSFILSFFNFFPLKILIIFSEIYSIMVGKTIFLVDFLANLEFFNILICTPRIFTIFLYYVFILIFLFLQKNEEIKYKIYILIIKQIKSKITDNLKKIIVILLIIIVIFTTYNNFNKPLKIYFVDVGQGDCTLIITPSNKKIIIDGGGTKSDSYNVGKKVLIPYLLDRGIKKIDYVIISHFDTDHVRRNTFCNKRIKSKYGYN